MNIKLFQLIEQLNSSSVMIKAPGEEKLQNFVQSKKKKKKRMPDPG